MSHAYAEKIELIEALQWHVDHGVDAIILDTPIDKTAMAELPKSSDLPDLVTAIKPENKAGNAPMGAAEAIIQAQKLVENCTDLTALKQAITDFDGLSIKKTATNMVFADGDPTADIMIIGEAPGAEDDIQGKAFLGETGQLLDKILASIHLSRQPTDSQKPVYISNMLNWRPPGNRTPTDSEISIALPFIEKHIALVKPKIIILLGGVVGKALLRRGDSISKLRGSFHDYKTHDGHDLKMLVTYHPAYLLKTPAQKKAVWADMLMLQDHVANQSADLG